MGPPSRQSTFDRPLQGISPEVEADSDVDACVEEPPSPSCLRAREMQGAAEAPAGPSAEFVSLSQEIERETEMWATKTRHLLECLPFSKPSTPTTGEGFTDSPQPLVESCLSVADSDDDAAEVRVATTAAMVNELPAGAASITPGDCVEASQGVADVVGVTPAQFDESGSDEDSSKGRIASALCSLGLDPTVENFIETLSTSRGESGNCEHLVEPLVRAQLSACQQWAAKRLRKKREQCAMWSDAGTPVAPADGKTPCSSSTCVLPLSSSDFMGVEQMVAKSSSSRVLAA